MGKRPIRNYDSQSRSVKKIKVATQLIVATIMVTLPAAANSITTTTAGGNEFDGNMFSAVIGPHSLDVTSLGVNVDAGRMIIDVYVKTGSYLGFETTPGAWTLVSATAVTGLGAGTLTPVNVTPFVLNANTTYSLYLTIDTDVNAAPYMNYSNGSSTYSNADLSLFLGEGLGGKFGSLGVFSPRTWNGTINYSAVDTPEPKTFFLLGTGILFASFLRRRR